MKSKGILLVREWLWALATALPTLTVSPASALYSHPSSTSASLCSPLCLLLGSSLPCEFRRGKLNKEVPCSADQCLIGQVLRDLGQQMVDRGHVTVTVQNFLLTIQHDLWEERLCITDQTLRARASCFSFSTEMSLNRKQSSA